ncbi:oligosaccharide flippase family protein [Plesiomonas sp.]|uniref:oligosaccharide flippase family protein n=1 Tax=Plesiomonas sp. TaxID=2486279 RepID=UPI003F31F770
MENKIYKIIVIAGAHIMKLLMGFIMLKIMAIYLGVDGLGKIANFMSLLTMASLLAGGGILNCLVKYVSEYNKNKDKTILFISSAINFSFFFSIAVCIIVSLFAKKISLLIFNNEESYYYIIALAFAQIGFAYINVIYGIINGLGENITFSKIQSLSVALAIPFFLWAVQKYHLNGAVFGLIVSFVIPVFPCLIYGSKSFYLRQTKIGYFILSDIKKIFSFTIMLLVSSVSFPIVEIIIRSDFQSVTNFYDVGIWQGAVRLSSAYTGLFSVVLGYWFVPIISSETSWVKIKKITFKVMLSVMAIFISGASVFYMFRDFFISTLLSSRFSELSDMIIYQLIGDFFKISAYVIGFVGVAKAAAKLYISAELIQGLMFLFFYFTMIIFIPNTKGVMMSYALTYIVYFFISMTFFLLVTNTKIKRKKIC